MALSYPRACRLRCQKVIGWPSSPLRIGGKFRRQMMRLLNNSRMYCTRTWPAAAIFSAVLVDMFFRAAAVFILRQDCQRSLRILPAKMQLTEYTCGMHILPYTGTFHFLTMLEAHLLSRKGDHHNLLHVAQEESTEMCLQRKWLTMF